jgi:hypothetical protein
MKIGIAKPSETQITSNEGSLEFMLLEKKLFHCKLKAIQMLSKHKKTSAKKTTELLIERGSPIQKIAIECKYLFKSLPFCHYF